MKPVFITLDPERDSVRQVGEYVREFHPKLIGLTGTMDQVGYFQHLLLLRDISGFHASLSTA